MKGYLVLENGRVFEGKVQNGCENILGSLSLQADGSVMVENHLNPIKGMAFNGNGFKIDGDATVLSDLDLKEVAEILNKGTHMYGKIVTDDMPMEYHLYDVKTYIPCGVM